ncbi:LCP family protein [Enteractinococcus coprophilus]|uniref:LytR family transcriptional attenuator n=1 Tax=Enteractinococcus coprophilus TaxID=1027633 RepID=A0A543AFE1_9MICC|nr:LCP family protein [Enteractinococcus coprophilus]TQL71297.1 LytR family transcriptional attenuator [Enteractinococcus coprophilus]
MTNSSTTRSKTERQIRLELNQRLRQLEYGGAGKDPLKHTGDGTFSQRTTRALLLIGLTTFVPGGAQSVTGNHRLGRIGLAVTLLNWGLIALIILGLLVARDFTLTLAFNPFIQSIGIFYLAAIAVGWLILWLDTARIIQFVKLKSGARALIAALLVVATLLTSGLTAYGAFLLNASTSSLGSIFGSGPAVDESDGRYNILIMGADAGEGRAGLRPDSISVASINADTGKIFLFSIPRNFQNAPFASDSPLWNIYPNGYSCGDNCIVNALYTDVTTNHPDLYPNAEDPGAEAMMDAVSGILDLDVTGYVMIDMAGFSELIDAMGGVTVTTGGWTPYRGVRPDGQWGNAWWEPGTHTFGGDDALGFARSRKWSSDYSRIRRQQCVQQAMLSQFDVPTLLTRFESILGAGEQMVETSIPQSQVGSFLNLGAKSKRHDMERLTIGAPDFGEQGEQFSTYPDFDEVHARVHEMLSADGTPPSGAHIMQPTLGLYLLDATDNDPTANWEPVPTQPDGSEITKEYLMWAEDAGQTTLLDHAAKTNHQCHPG